ncbi:hypothetical protein [Dyadobacter sp. CY326]|uniref:hypothetical protein n=1 Tax=Dyadobacter sp. CY326 TaxID=2907300 RepID=UPI001F178B32|nr:hypothetical protein [Dyadobacter sp. CY326]MCE7063821.1 hypothetical protein [Dyadobacter sp. CY326]
MMSSHSNFHTLSRSITPYLHEANKGFGANAKNVRNEEHLALKDLKIHLQEKTKSIERLIGFLEDVTWLDIPDDQTRTAIVDLIHIAKLYHKEEQVYGASLQADQTNKELEEFLLALDDLKETIQDVKSAIITLPKLDGYNEIFDELSRL